MASKITVSVDSTGDVSAEDIEKYGFKVIPNGIVIGGEFKSDANVTAADIYKAVEDDHDKPKTNAALEVDYRKVFEDATKDGGSVIQFTISGKLSASNANAQRAAQGLERVHVVDSKSAAFGVGVLAVKAKELVDQGLSFEEVVKRAEELRDNLEVSFIIHDLKYLHRGGRVSGMKLLGANLMKIRPTIDFDKDGRMVPGKKFKGSWPAAVREHTKYRLEKNPNYCREHVCINYTDIDSSIPEQMDADLRAAGFKKITHHHVGPTIAIHTGRNTIGFLAFDTPDV